MANKQAIRELQSRLAERLQASQDRSQSANWLAVEAGGRGFLLPLAEAGEIFTGTASLMAVPHTSRWFVGVANLRGHLHGVVDWAGFLGLRSAEKLLREQVCLVAFNAALDINCALLVDRLAGLRGREQSGLRAEALPTGGPSFLTGVWRDGQGRVWNEVGLAALSAHEAFLKILD